MKRLAAALLLLASLGLRAEEAVWMLPDVVPAVIHDGPFAHQGGSEVALHALGRALPQFSWHYEVATPLRELHDIALRDGLCSWGFAKLPERESFIVFNNRPMISPGYGLILREDRLGEFQPFLDADGAIDLDRLGAAKKLRGGFPVGRPHYGPLGEFLDKNGDHVTGDTDTIRMFRQLKARHLDYLIGVRDEALYFAATLGPENKVVALPIAGMPRYGKGYIGCSKGPIGEAVIAAVDAYLTDDAHWAAFIAPWARWMPPADYAAALASPVIR